MIKLDIANEMTQLYPCSRDMAITVIDLLLEKIKDALLNGERIEIRGFGVFELRLRKSGFARNVKTGQSVKIPMGKTIRFKPGKGLRSQSS